jgi:arylsulfatase A-like enzyme
VILTDDQTYRAIGYNNPVVKTPNLDRLAADGIIFDNAYTASPICIASRSSIMTGLFPQQHGTVALDEAPFTRRVIEQHEFPTLPQMLSNAGYATALCGKSHIGAPTTYGFTIGEEHKGPKDEDAFMFAQEFLKSREGNDTPFLLWLGARQPHVPLNPADEFLAMYDRDALDVDPNFLESPPPESIYNQGVPGEHYYRDSGFTTNYKNVSSGPPRSKELMLDFIHAYYATISHLDAQIGELVDQLKAANLYDNTVIVFLSDNGYHLGNHGLGNKITMHEESVRVPMFMHGPRLNARGLHSQALASSLDVFPTLLALAGVDAPAHLMGTSLLPAIANPADPLREFVASECVGVKGKLGEGHRMVRTAQWKYVLTDVNDEALFDEQNDPYEMTNLAAAPEHQPRLIEMRALMKRWMESVGDTHTPPPSLSA